MRSAMVEEMIKMIFTTTEPTSPRHDCVFVLEPIFTVRNMDGVHAHLRTGDQVTLYNLTDPHLKVGVTVHKAVPGYIMMIFKTVEGASFECITESSEWNTRLYYQLAVNPETRTVEWCEGMSLYHNHDGITRGNTSGTPGNVILNDCGKFLGIVVGTVENTIKYCRAGEIELHLPFKPLEDYNFVLC